MQCTSSQHDKLQCQLTVNQECIQINNIHHSSSQCLASYLQGRHCEHWCHLLLIPVHWTTVNWMTRASRLQKVHLNYSKMFTALGPAYNQPAVMTMCIDREQIITAVMQLYYEWRTPPSLLKELSTPSPSSYTIIGIIARGLSLIHIWRCRRRG